MNPKQLIRRALDSVGYSLLRNDAPRNISTPMNSLNVARLIYYQSLLDKTKSVPGDIIECGVGQGRSLLSLSLLTKITNDKRTLWGFDSFEGFPEPHSIDMNSPRKPAKGENAVNMVSIYRMLSSYINDEQFIRSHITLVKGYFDKTLDSFPGKQISLVNLDVDLYDSYKICLEKLYPKLSVGGIITFDEYIRESFAYPGASKAIDEFFSDKDVAFTRDPYFGKYYVVKPASS